MSSPKRPLGDVPILILLLALHGICSTGFAQPIEPAPPECGPLQKVIYPPLALLENQCGQKGIYCAPEILRLCGEGKWVRPGYPGWMRDGTKGGSYAPMCYFEYQCCVGAADPNLPLPVTLIGTSLGGQIFVQIPPTGIIPVFDRDNPGDVIDLLPPAPPAAGAQLNPVPAQNELLKGGDPLPPLPLRNGMDVGNNQ